VLLPSQWQIGEVDGSPMMLVTNAGLRALALMSPRPDAPEAFERLIARRIPPR
jgi:hypothetical protein